jgi:hypothetical protein
MLTWTVPWGFGKLLAYINEKYMLPNDIPLIVTEQASLTFPFPILQLPPLEIDFTLTRTPVHLVIR